MTDPARPLEVFPFRLPRTSQVEASVLLKDGLVRPVIADVLVVADAPDDVWVRAQATRLLLPEHSRDRWVVGFRTAVWVLTGRHGHPDPAAEGPPPGAEVIVQPAQQRPNGPHLRGRQVALAAGEVTELYGLLVTTALRTAADVARDAPPEDAMVMLSTLAEECGVRAPQLLRQLSRMPYARGCAKARPVVRAWAEL